MKALVKPNGHGDCIFRLVTETGKDTLQYFYETKPSTSLDIIKGYINYRLDFYEDEKKTDSWLISDFKFEDINACMLRFPELRVWLEGM